MPDALHTPLRQTTGVPQAWPSGSPHFPSLKHTLEAHCATRVHVCPFGSTGVHVPGPVSHQKPPAQSPSVVQVAAHVAPGHAPLRQAAPLAHAPPIG
jgi:hypothetical protein